VLRGDDALEAIRAGASGILVSNHGGRQLDGVQPRFEEALRIISCPASAIVFVKYWAFGRVKKELTSFLSLSQILSLLKRVSSKFLFRLGFNFALILHSRVYGRRCSMS
jgi:hypothetical protein